MSKLLPKIDVVSLIACWTNDIKLTASHSISDILRPTIILHTTAGAEHRLPRNTIFREFIQLYGVHQQYPAEKLRTERGFCNTHQTISLFSLFRIVWTYLISRWLVRFRAGCNSSKRLFLSFVKELRGLCETINDLTMLYNKIVYDLCSTDVNIES